MTRTELAAAWTVAIISMGTNLVPVVNGPQGYDTAPLTTAVHTLFDGGHVYTARGAGDFLYPPSALLLLMPLAALSIAWAGRLFFVFDLATVLCATGLLLRVFNLRWRGFSGALALFGLSLAWPVIFTLDAGNINGPVLLGLAGFLLAAARGRWSIAGVCLGLTLSLKPILAPVLLVLVLYRRWPAAGVAVAVPVALSAPLLAAAPSTRSFFDTTLPLLWRGQNAQIQDASISLGSAAARLSMPGTVTGALKIAVAAITVALLWRRWRTSSGEPRRLVELTTIVLVGAFLLSSFAFSHYGVFLIPFAISLADRSSPHRHWLTAGLLFCIGTRQGWGLNRLPHRLNEALAQRFTFALLLLLLSFWLGLRREAERQQAAEPLADASDTPPPPSGTEPAKPLSVR